MLLFDSNIIIYSAKPAFIQLRELALSNEVCCSAISRLEVLGFHQLRESERKILKEIFNELIEFDISVEVIDRAIEIRSIRTTTVGDSIIAATALLYDLTLVTNNEKDFRHLRDLKIRNPIRNR